MTNWEKKLARINEKYEERMADIEMRDFHKYNPNASREERREARDEIIYEIREKSAEDERMKRSLEESREEEKERIARERRKAEEEERKRKIREEEIIQERIERERKEEEQRKEKEREVAKEKARQERIERERQEEKRRKEMERKAREKKEAEEKRIAEEKRRAEEERKRIAEENRKKREEQEWENKQKEIATIGMPWNGGMYRGEVRKIGVEIVPFKQGTITYVRDGKKEEWTGIWFSAKPYQGEGTYYYDHAHHKKYYDANHVENPEYLKYKKYSGRYFDGKVEEGVFEYENGEKLEISYNRTDKNKIKITRGVHKIGDKKCLGLFENDKPIFAKGTHGLLSGEWRDGKFTGKGRKYYLPNGGVYDGEWQDDKRSGFGKLTTREYSYEGEWKNDSPFGKGKKILEDGTILEGKFTNLNNGRGFITDKKDNRDSKYEGEWENDQPHGNGKITIKSLTTEKNKTTVNDIFYEGGWQDGKFHGEGKLVCSSFSYEGWFKKGWMHGYGIVRRKDRGDEFHLGYFADNKAHGKGTKKHQDGLIYVGEWKEGMLISVDNMKWGEGIYEGIYSGRVECDENDGKPFPQGQGNIIYSKNGEESFQGIWKDKKPFSGKGIYRNQDCECNGSFIDGRPYNAKGSFKIDEDNYFSGEWKDGKFSGKGKETKNGTIYEGEWQEDNKIIGILKYSDSKTLKFDQILTDDFSTQQRTTGTHRDGSNECEGVFIDHKPFDAQGTIPNNKNLLKGVWVDGNLVKGKKKYSDGIYEGEFQNNLPHGNGKMDFNHKSEHLISYDGKWKEGVTNGKAIIKYRDGTIYEGETKNNARRNGFGKMTFNDKSEYEGEWVSDKFHGKGTMKYHDGSTYYGEWREDKKEGEGQFSDANSSGKYDGKWKNDQAQGPGTKTTEGGVIYHGEWHQNVAHGEMNISYPDGKSFVGRFSHGRPFDTKEKSTFVDNKEKTFQVKANNFVEKINHEREGQWIKGSRNKNPFKGSGNPFSR